MAMRPEYNARSPLPKLKDFYIKKPEQAIVFPLKLKIIQVNSLCQGKILQLKIPHIM